MQTRQPQGFKLPGIVLLAYPFIEIFGFIAVGHWLGILGALGLLIATTMLGSYLLRSCGFDFRGKMAAGMNAWSLMDPRVMFKMFAGFLLVLPGFVSDLAGLILLIPFMQRLLLSRVVKRTANQSTTHPNHERPAANDKKKGQVIEGECWRDDD